MEDKLISPETIGICKYFDVSIVDFNCIIRILVNERYDTASIRMYSYIVYPSKALSELENTKVFFTDYPSVGMERYANDYESLPRSTLFMTSNNETGTLIKRKITFTPAPGGIAVYIKNFIFGGHGKKSDSKHSESNTFFIPMNQCSVFYGSPDMLSVVIPINFDSIYGTIFDLCCEYAIPDTDITVCT